MTYFWINCPFKKEEHVLILVSGVMYCIDNCAIFVSMLSFVLFRLQSGTFLLEPEHWRAAHIFPPETSGKSGIQLHGDRLRPRSTVSELLHRLTYTGQIIQTWSKKTSLFNFKVKIR